MTVPPLKRVLIASYCAIARVAAGGFDTVAFSQAPTAGATSWHVVHPTYDEPKQSCLEKSEPVAFRSSPRGSLNGISCAGESLCVAVRYEGSVFVSTDPTGGASAWSVGEVNEGHGATHLTAVSCPSTILCVAVSGGSNNSNGGKVLTSTDPTGGPGTWHFENLVPFRPTENGKNSSPHETRSSPPPAPRLPSAPLVGIDGRIFTATDPFSASDPPPSQRRHKTPRRPRTILVFAEHFWKVATTRRRHIGARFRFYSPTRTRGFECKRDHGPYRPCHSPLRYRVPHGRHILRVRAIGPTGLRDPAAIKRFRVQTPIKQRR